MIQLSHCHALESFPLSRLEPYTPARTPGGPPSRDTGGFGAQAQAWGSADEGSGLDRQIDELRGAAD